MYGIKIRAIQLQISFKNFGHGDHKKTNDFESRSKNYIANFSYSINFEVYSIFKHCFFKPEKNYENVGADSKKFMCIACYHFDSKSSEHIKLVARILLKPNKFSTLEKLSK